MNIEDVECNKQLTDEELEDLDLLFPYDLFGDDDDDDNIFDDV